MTFDLKIYLADKRRLVEDRLESILSDHSVAGGHPVRSRLFQAMHYSLMGPGKRLRPILCLAASELVGREDPEPALRTACAIEMIHTYSLVHDDLPAMDDDALRRGRPTCHVQFDEATAVLAGDALLTLAFEVLSGAGSMQDDPPEPDRRLAIIARIAKAAGNRGMIEGQMRDMLAQDQNINLDSLEEIHRLKTGAMIEASVAAGALCGGGSPAQVDALSAYARHIGLAFQVADDILNVEGSPEIMGKAAGTDNLLRKATYPALLGLDGSKKYAAELIRQALQSLEIFDNKAFPLVSIAQYIIKRNR